LDKEKMSAVGLGTTFSSDADEEEASGVVAFGSDDSE